MRLIDLQPEEKGGLCSVCGEGGGHAVAELHDRDLGPVCAECFGHGLRAERALMEGLLP